jgi:hypothetical protein
MQFAEKIGLVYFGYVDQRSDEHRLVRGLTTSPHYRDNHYCVGAFDGYDIALVERSGTLKHPGQVAELQDWLIATIDLRTTADLPHIFIGRRSHSQAFYSQLFTKFTYMMPLPLTEADGYDVQFLLTYVLYAKLTEAAEVSRLFDTTLTKAIADHFHGLTIEVSDGCVYVYAENQRPSGALLDRMVRYGVWLAQTIDAKMMNK